MKHQLDEENQSFNKLTDKIFGVDTEKECLSHLVCGDMNNTHKIDGWIDENYIDYRRILKNRGIKINDKVIEDEKKIVNLKDFSNNNYIKLSVGKKTHLKVTIT